jgi:two-component system sensor histidine kinase HupT/HoxJ
VLNAQLREKLGTQDFLLTRPDMLWAAAVVLVDTSDPRRDIASVRSLARSDVAIVVLHDAPEPCGARDSGALGCVHPPFAKDELLALVETALDLRAANAKVAALNEKLDVETHLASIGRVAAGLSHELANPLSAAILNLRTIEDDLGRILGAREALRDVCFAPLGLMEERIRRARATLERLDETTELPAALADLRAGIQRMQSLIVSLRPFTRNTVPRLEAVDLDESVRKVLKWAERDLEGIDVELALEPLKALAEPSALGQLLFNLATNAAHAAKTLSSPRVRIHVYTSGERAIISVRDNGPGIPDDLQARIFEPFYTTKRNHGGTGLGLALCREYARQIDGSLSVWSHLGRGACFRLSLRRPDRSEGSP